MIKFRCPYCGQKLGVPAEYAGRRVRCTKCQQASAVPPPPETKPPAESMEPEALNLRLEPEEPPPPSDPVPPAKPPNVHPNAQTAQTPQAPFRVPLIWHVNRVIQIGSMIGTLAAAVVILAMLGHMSWAVFTAEVNPSVAGFSRKSVGVSLARSRVLEMIEDPDLMVIVSALDRVMRKEMTLETVRQMYLVQLRQTPEEEVPEPIVLAYMQSYDHYDAMNRTERILLLQFHYGRYEEYTRTWKKDK